MKKRFLALSALLALALSACARPAPAEEEGLRVLCTTYPVYLFTTAVTHCADGVETELLVNAQTSCLHDYTLTVADMKAVERADVIVISGLALEEFLSGALDGSSAPVIDASAGILPLPALSHGHHEGRSEGYDPHYWMDPQRAGQAVETIAGELARLDSANAGTYRANAGAALRALEQALPSPEDGSHAFPLITFHDGFQYFAASEGFRLLRSIEEEDGATVSAAEIRELTELIEAEGIPAVFVEKNGSRLAAGVLSRETGCAVYELDMLMSGDGEGIQPYLDAIEENRRTVYGAFGLVEKEADTP